MTSTQITDQTGTARPAGFERRDQETRKQISAVIDRGWDQAPEAFGSYVEYVTALAHAYAERARFWREVVQHAIHHGPGGLAFSAMVDAQSAYENRAWELTRHARGEVRQDQERAWRSYAENVAAVA